jgi:hypothetical protein
MTELTIRPIHLHHLDAVAVKEPEQSRPIRTGPLHPHLGNRPEALELVQEAAVAGLGNGERLHSQQAADVIEGGGDMKVDVGVDPAGHGGKHRGIYDGHRPSLSLVYVLQGVARTTGTADA